MERRWPARSLLIPVCILGGLTFAVFSNSFTAQLTLDSNFVIAEDSRVHALHLENLERIFSTDYWYPGSSRLYRPVTTSSYLFNYALLGNGAHPAGYHWINFLLHWGNAILVFGIGLVLFETRGAALSMAALFAVHPVTVEAVTNIAGRADLLSAGAVLGGFLLYLASRSSNGPARTRYLAALSLVSLAGVFAKENAAVLVGLMALYDLALGKRRPLKAAYAVVIGTLAVMFAVRWSVFRHSGPVPDFFLDNPILGASFWQGRLTALAVLAKDFRLLIWPLHLSPTYSFHQVPIFHWPDWPAVVALLAIAALLVFTAALYRRDRRMFFLLAWIFIALLPTSNLFVLIGSILAERFLYLPLVGFSGCIVLLALNFVPRRSAPALLAVLIAALAIRTYIRNFDWQDNLHLWTAAERVAPGSYATHLWLAAAWFHKPPQGSEVDRAILEAETAAAIVQPLPVEERMTPICVPLGTYYRIKSTQSPDPVEQHRWLQKSVDVLSSCIPIDQAYRDSMRRAELARGRRPQDIVDTGDFRLYESLGQSLLRLGENQKALDAFLTMQRLAPFDPDADLDLGDAYLALGQKEQGAIAYGEALIAQPDSVRAGERLMDLYAHTDKQGCAIDIDRHLNPFCPLVHDNLCLSYSRLAGLVRARHQLDVAERLQNAAVTSEGCPAAPAMPKK